ncbi:MAG TPA: hypothetical protein VHZ24_03600 [Pirellulales bacterium]|nr:hypothetical protein [Pirellulales bacterium]
MHSRLHHHFMGWLSVILIGGLCAVAISRAADDPKSTSPEAKAAKKQRADARGYLPPYYKNVVDPTQREKIYKIQNSYDEKIDALEKQLKELSDQRDAEIEAVLTPEQKKKVQELAAAAKANRSKKTAAAEPAPSAEGK